MPYKDIDNICSKCMSFTDELNKDGLCLKCEAEEKEA